MRSITVRASDAGRDDGRADDSNETSAQITQLCDVLIADFACHEIANKRKGGLLGLAAMLVGVKAGQKPAWTDEQGVVENVPGASREISSHTLKRAGPVILAAFGDIDPRVRYYATEAMYNVVKTFRGELLVGDGSGNDGSVNGGSYLATLFNALCDLSADADADVQNAAHLLDRLVKDVVSEASGGTNDSASLTEVLGTAIANRCGITNGVTSSSRPNAHTQNGNSFNDPYTRQFLIGWITSVDAMPDIDALQILPLFFDGLLKMLSDPNREIRQQADGALSVFLVEIKQELLEGDRGDNNSSVDLAALSKILEVHTRSLDEFTRVTAVTWLREFVQIASNSVTRGNQLKTTPNRLAEMTAAVLPCLSHKEPKVRDVASKASGELLAAAVKEAGNDSVNLEALLSSLALCAGSVGSTTVTVDEQSLGSATRAEALGGYQTLLNTAPDRVRALILGRDEDGDNGDNNKSKTSQTSPSFSAVLFNLASDDEVSTQRALDVLARLGSGNEGDFDVVARALVFEFYQEERRGNLLDENETSRTATTTGRNSDDSIVPSTTFPPSFLRRRGSRTLRFLCACLGDAKVVKKFAEIVGEGFLSGDDDNSHGSSRLSFATRFTDVLNVLVLTALECETLRKVLRDTAHDSNKEPKDTLFKSLFPCWYHSPAATVGLCLLAGVDELAVFVTNEMCGDETELSVDTLIRLDQLVHVLETPVFASLRLGLLDPKKRSSLHRALYSVLMLLPQSGAWRILNDRLKGCRGFFSGYSKTEAEHHAPELDPEMTAMFKMIRAAHRNVRAKTKT